MPLNQVVMAIPFLFLGSLLLERSRGGKKVPAPLLRMRANDLLAGAFPQVLACPETLPGGPIEVPMDHPIVAQTIEDCLTEAMDVEGLKTLLRGMAMGRIRVLAVDTPVPSQFSHEILNANPYAFLDDAPLEIHGQPIAVLRPTAAEELVDVRMLEVVRRLLHLVLVEHVAVGDLAHRHVGNERSAVGARDSDRERRAHVARSAQHVEASRGEAHRARGPRERVETC